jgi:tetratricopeptide (TPR) repeat protein
MNSPGVAVVGDVRGRMRVPVWFVLLTALAIPACGPSPTEPAGEDRLVVRVLPFEVRGQAEGADYVGRAIAASLANALAESADVRLPDDPAGRAATRVIRGTLTREGDALHAGVQLLDPATDELLWQTESSSAGGDFPELVFQLAGHAIEALGASPPDLYDYIVDVTGGSRMSVSELAARARASMRRSDIDGFLEASMELVTQYGDDPAAHVLNAWALMLAWDAAPSDESYLARLKERMVSLDRVDPASPYDEIVRGYIYRSSGQPDEARSAYSRVLERTDLSGAARAWILRQRSFAQLASGNAAAAHGDAEKAVELDPVNALSLVALSKALEAIGRLDDAVTVTNHALALQPSSWRHFQRLGLVYSRAERLDEAVLAFERACRLGERQEACANLAVTLQRAGRETEAREAAADAESLAASPFGYYNLACFWAVAGDRAATIDSLERSVELGFADALITTDPDLDAVRGDPEFEAIVAAVESRISSRRELSRSVFPWQG